MFCASEYFFLSPFVFPLVPAPLHLRYGARGFHSLNFSSDFSLLSPSPSHDTRDETPTFLETPADSENEKQIDEQGPSWIDHSHRQAGERRGPNFKRHQISRLVFFDVGAHLGRPLPPRRSYRRLFRVACPRFENHHRPDRDLGKPPSRSSEPQEPRTIWTILRVVEGRAVYSQLDPIHFAVSAFS